MVTLERVFYSYNLVSRQVHCMKNKCFTVFTVITLFLEDPLQVKWVLYSIILFADRPIACGMGVF